MSIEAMNQALEVLEQINQLSIGENAIALPGEIDAAMDNLRAAIKQAEKPMAWFHEEKYKTHFTTDPSPDMIGKYWQPLYTTPPAAQQEPDAYGYAKRLAVAIWEQHYKITAPQWKPLDDLMGVLTQIDNMTAGLTALRAAIEQYDQTALELCKECGWKALIPGDGCLVCARQKPVAWMYDFLNSDDRDEVIRDWMTQDYADITRENGFNVRPLYTAPPTITQKPVAYADSRIHGWPDCFVMEPDPPHTTPLYTETRQWVGLTEDEMNALVSRFARYELARAIEAKLKEKNT